MREGRELTPDVRFNAMRVNGMEHFQKAVEIGEQRKDLLRQMEEIKDNDPDSTLKMSALVRAWEDLTRKMQEEEMKSRDWIDAADDLTALTERAKKMAA